MKAKIIENIENLKVSLEYLKTFIEKVPDGSDIEQQLENSTMNKMLIAMNDRIKPTILKPNDNR